METWLIPAGVIVVFLMLRAIWAWEANRIPPLEQVSTSATATTPTPQSPGRPDGGLSVIFIGQITVSALVLISSLALLVFGSTDHPWRAGAQSALMVVIGFWLNHGSANR